MDVPFDWSLIRQLESLAKRRPEVTDETSSGAAGDLSAALCRRRDAAEARLLAADPQTVWNEFQKGG